jgi:hypothetical protein
MAPAEQLQTATGEQRTVDSEALNVHAKADLCYKLEEIFIVRIA